jgi:LacI family transcriptional regulator
LIDRQLPGLDANFVGVSDEEVGRQATEHLISCGCREIAHLGGPEITPAQGRQRGYRTALAAHGLQARPRHTVRGCLDDRSGAEGMRKLLRTTPRPDGVFCFNDSVAAGALRALMEAGVSIPGQVRVVGAGNIHFSDLLTVPLTTVDQSAGEIGKRAAELLLELVKAKRPRTPRQIVLPPRLIARRSSAGALQ